MTVVQRTPGLVVALRVLGCIALVLGIVLMAAVLWYGWQAQRAVSGFGEVVGDVPAFELPPDECWTAPDGDELCAPGGEDGLP